MVYVYVVSGEVQIKARCQVCVRRWWARTMVPWIPSWTGTIYTTVSIYTGLVTFLSAEGFHLRWVQSFVCISFTLDLLNTCSVEGEMFMVYLHCFLISKLIFTKLFFWIVVCWLAHLVLRNTDSFTFACGKYPIV